MNLNQCILAGAIASAPERVGDNLVSARIVVVEETKDGREFKVFIPCEAYGQSGEALAQLDEGDPVLVSGKISYRSWTDKDGKRQGGLRVSCWSVQTLARVGV